MKYYSLEPLLSRGAKLSFCIGDRGVGKSYDFKRWAFQTWKATGAEWVLVRRNTDEIVTSKGNFWDDYITEQGYQVKSKGYKCFIRPQIPLELEGKEKTEWEEANPWRPFGYFIALTEGQTFKSASFPKVDKICFDEFIIENTRKRYIPDEVDHFMGLIDTIARRRKIRVVALSNAGYIDNPYFIYYGIKSREFDNASFVRRNNGAVLFEYYRSDATAEEKAAYTMSQIANDSYKNYAIESKFKDGGSDLVRSKPSGATPYLKVSRDGNFWLTVYTKPGEPSWVGYGNGNCPAYTLDKWKVIENAVYNSEVIATLKDALNARDLTFESPDVRAVFVGWLKDRQV